MDIIKGKVWKFGNSIDTDIIIPACHLVLPLEEMKVYAMAPLSTDFAERVRNGDIIVAGKNFGCGSSREQAPAILKALGIKAIIAVSFARIFFRNAINLGLPVIECGEVYSDVQEGDFVEIDLEAGIIHIPASDKEFSGSKLPAFLLEIVEAGGLIPHLAPKAAKSGVE